MKSDIFRSHLMGGATLRSYGEWVAGRDHFDREIKLVDLQGVE